MQPSRTVEPLSATAGFRVFSRIVGWVATDRMQLLDITERIDEIVRRGGIRDGLVHLQPLHTTSAVFIDEWPDDLVHDVKGFFEQVVSRERYYRLRVRNAAFLLGTWQSIIFAEFDGPRSRSLAVQVSGV